MWKYNLKINNIIKKLDIIILDEEDNKMMFSQS